MLRSILLSGLVFSALSSSAQEFEIIPTSKETELFTTETMDTIHAKVNELQHPTEIVYYQLSAFTTIKILPAIKETLKKEE